MPPAIRCILPLLVAAGLAAADTVLLDGVSVFEPVWIGEATKELVPAPDQGGQALRLVVAQKPAALYMSQTFVDPLATGVEAGDVLAITFAARCIKPNGGTVVVSCGLDRDPWTQAVFKELAVGPAWKEYALEEKAAATIPAGAARFGFHFGHQAQTLEIAKLRVVRRGK